MGKNGNDKIGLICVDTKKEQKEERKCWEKDAKMQKKGKLD